MHDYYEVNVSLNGVHFFATAPHSIRYAETLAIVYKEIKERFSVLQGFEVTVIHWETRGKSVNMSVIPPAH